MPNPRLAVVAAVAGLTACSGSYDRDRAIEDLMVDAEIERPTAACIVEGVEEEFGVGRLRGRGGLTVEESAVLDTITFGCLAADGGARG